MPPIACQQAQSYSRCRSTSIIVSPNPIGPAVQTVFPKRLKIKCANRHVPSATNRFSMGTVIFPRSKTSISASPCCDRTSRSDIIRERAKNKDCANRNRHVPSVTDRLSTGTFIFPMSKQIDYCLSHQTVFAKRLKIKCANRHVPSATNRVSMGTVIFPRSNHID